MYLYHFTCAGVVMNLCAFLLLIFLTYMNLVRLYIIQNMILLFPVLIFVQIFFMSGGIELKANMNRYKLHKTAAIFFSSELLSETGY